MAGIKDLITQIPPEYRLYLQTMFPGQKTGTIDEGYFSQDFKDQLKDQVLSKMEMGMSFDSPPVYDESMRFMFPSGTVRKGNILPGDYRTAANPAGTTDPKYYEGERGSSPTGYSSPFNTLGTYQYEYKMPTAPAFDNAAIVVTDKYDWNPMYGTVPKQNFTGYIGEGFGDVEGSDVDAKMLFEFVKNQIKNKELDTASALELIGNYLGPRESEGEGKDIRIEIPVDTPTATTDDRKKAAETRRKDLQQMRGPIGRDDPAPTRSQNVARTASRVGPGGRVRAYGLKEGGRVNYALGSPEPLNVSNEEKRIAFDLYQALKDIEEQYTGETIAGDPSPQNLDPSDRRQETLMADATTELDQAPDSFLRPRRYDIIEGKELPAETLEDFDVMFRKPNAAGGRVGFYKGELVTDGPQKGMYKVKFPGKSNAPGYPDNFVGTQFGTEDEIDKLISDRKEFTAESVKTKVNPAKQQGEETLKALIDDTFAKGDFENFKIKLQPSTVAAAERKGKTRIDLGGKVPQQYLGKFNKAMEAGPGSDLFKELIKVTGRTEQELLELDSKRPGGKVDPKIRSERALEFGGNERRLTDEELVERGRLYARKRAEKEAVGKKYASSEDMLRFNTVNDQKKTLNKFFKNNPDAINNTKFGEKIKALMETRLDKDGNIIRRKTDSKGNPLNDEYYRNLAEKGSIFDIFDINKISKGQRSTKFATNLNITPGQFNSAFIEGQVNKLFKKGGKFHGDTEKLNKISSYLKDIGVRVDIENVGRIGADMGVAYDSKTGKFPHIYRTLKNMDIPDTLLLKINPKPNIPGVDVAADLPEPKKTTERNMFSRFNEKYRSSKPIIQKFSSNIPGSAAVLAPYDVAMMLSAGAPVADALASGASYLAKDPYFGRAVNIPLALREMTSYGDEKEMLQKATERREGIESMLENIPTRFKEIMAQNKGVKDETEKFVP